MDNVLHVPAFKDNYIWLITDGFTSNVAIVDPGDADPVIRALEQRHLKPTAILCTHHHADHIGGIKSLVQRYPMPVIGPGDDGIPDLTHVVSDGDRIGVPGLRVTFDVLATPGHTLGHIAFYSDLGGDGMLFCGDTLFSAGCGRLFEGTPAQMHASLSRLASLSDDTRVYCAHEYTAANLRFALTVEPDNCDIREYANRVNHWRADNRPSLPSTIGLERRVNPFLRATQPSVKQAVQSHAKLTTNSEIEIFAALRRWKDGFKG